MVSMRSVEEQLKRAGCKFQMWGRAEIKELTNVLMDSEEIRTCLNGHYSGGFALLTATNQRILLIDKKPMFLTVEDIRYDMISEIEYSHQLLDATVRIFTPTKSLVFTSWNKVQLRSLVMGAQQHVMSIRQYQQQLSTLQNRHLQGELDQQNQPAAQVPSFSYGQELQVNQVGTATEAVDLPVVEPVPITQTASQPSFANPSVMPFGNPMNPFLRAPLITRHRDGLRALIK